jgi:DDE family transposase
MPTECTQRTFRFHHQSGREVVARFDGGCITSDGGGLLLREVERRTGILQQFAGCFTDHRDPEQVEHTVRDLVSQRVYGLTLGYEDLNDHDELRRDPLLATLVGKADPLGRDRVRARDVGAALAGKSTLNRLELTKRDAGPASRYKKIVLDGAAVDRVLVEVFLQAHARPPRQIVLDLDATDDPLHGRQEGRFFHGYYGCYCYLPLYIFCGEHLLCARLRPSDIDASAGALEEVQRIVEQVWARWPRVRIILRADSGFAREAIMAWCEESGVDYVFGLAKNARLTRVIGKELHQVQLECERTGQPARAFQEITYKTRKSWSRARRVVGKAEHLPDKSNPRFVVTSLSSEEWDARALYEDLYCARGDMENRIKEQQLYLFADRTSTATMRANQIRLYLSSVAYLLLHALRRLGLKGTTMARAQCHTIRLKLLKIGAQVRVTVRKVWLSLASGSPYADLFARAWANLQAVPLHT